MPNENQGVPKVKLVLQKIKQALQKIYKFFTVSDSGAKLVGKCLLMLVIPYAYLFLCGFIFDFLLKWYFMTNFIFVSLIAFYLLAFATIFMAIKKYVSKK